MNVIDKIQDLLNKSWVAIVLSFVLGLILGLPILGWTIWPVKWVDTTPDTLREEYKKEYIRMMIDSFAINSDRAVAEQIALQRWNSLGPDAGSLFIQLNGDERLNPLYYTEFSKIISTELGEDKQGTEGESIEEGEVGEVEQTSDEFLQTAEAAASVEDKQTEGESDEESSGLFKKLGLVIIIFCVLIVVVGGSLAYLLFIRKKTSTVSTSNEQFQQYSHTDEAITEPEEVVFEEYLEEAEESHTSPIAQFTTTYNIGDDLYDDSFSIDAPAPSGEFLGECGVGISDTIGAGDPKQVSAFEVWLFDKNDVQTVTKVIMAENSFNDNESRQKLEAKGELILLEPNLSVVLETTTLQLEARVVDYHYPEDTQPMNSSIDRISLELTVWLK